MKIKRVRKKEGKQEGKEEVGGDTVSRRKERYGDGSNLVGTRGRK